MRPYLLVFFHALSFAVAFRVGSVQKWYGERMLKMSVVDHQIDVFAKDMELTPSMKDRVNNKIKKVVDKLGHDALSTHVVLRVVKYPNTETHSHHTKAQIAEVTVQYKGGGVVHVSEGTDDMYSSIDMVAHKLARTVKKHNEKLRDKRRRAQRADEVDDAAGAETDFDIDELVQDLDPKYRGRIGGEFSQAMPLNMVRPKKFPMPPISLEEAIGALEYIDHPFYVFRNKETNEINVVYRRKSGGVGLISPSPEGSM